MRRNDEQIDDVEQLDTQAETKSVNEDNLAFDGLTTYARSRLPRSYEQQLKVIRERLLDSPY